MLQGNREAECLVIANNIVNHTIFCFINFSIGGTGNIDEKMCKTPVALHNSTHIGPNQNTAIINSWRLFLSYTGENGDQHHALHSNMYMWMIMVAIGLVIIMI